MRLALIVTTYDRPDALARMLETVARQSSAPDEILIADDGSGLATRDVIEGFRYGMPVAVKHCWLAHDGFQAGRMRNRAIEATDCEYLVLVDGDMLLHPQFVADHRRAARSGEYQQGTRVPLNEESTQRALTNGALPTLASPGLGVRRRLHAWHAPRFGRLLCAAANALVATKSCNQGFWREDLLRINGFDEQLTGWGAEDKELCARLENTGVRRRTILFGAIAFHLAHPPADRSSNVRNLAAVARTRTTGRTRCDHGIVSAPKRTDGN